MPFLTPSHQVFFGRPLCLIPSTFYTVYLILWFSFIVFNSVCMICLIKRLVTYLLTDLTSHVIQHLTQSLPSFHSTCSNHLDLLLLIHQTDQEFSEFFTFLSFVRLNPTHPSDCTYFSAIDHLRPQKSYNTDISLRRSHE